MRSRDPKDAAPTERAGVLERILGWFERPSRRRGLEVAIVALVFGLFVHAASNHAERFNLAVNSSDQSAYLSFAEKTRRLTGLHLDGSRGPGYPLALLLVHERGLDRDVFFERAKTLTIYLTALIWVGVWLYLRRLLPLGLGLAVWAVIALTCLVQYAPYVKAEAPYFALNCLAFLLLGAALAKPSPRAALLAGALVGVAYLFKNSARILLLAYAVGVGVDLVLGAVGQRGTWRDRLRALAPRLLAPPLVLIAFLSVCAPFLIVSARKYGHAFYNVNDFYAWYDSWAEAKTGTRAHKDRAGWPKMAKRDIPTAGKYLASHSSSQIQRRLAGGWKRSLGGMERRSMLGYAYLYLAALAVLAIVRFRRTAALVRASAAVVALSVAYLVGHALLSSWFEVIASGPRVIAAGFPVLLCACAIGLSRLTAERSSARLRFQRATWAFTLVVSLWLAVDVSRAVHSDLRAAKGGR